MNTGTQQENTFPRGQRGATRPEAGFHPRRGAHGPASIWRTLVAGLFFGAVMASAAVTTYPAPPNVFPGDTFIAQSNQYKVEIVQDGRAVDSFVYLMHAQHYTNNSQTASFTNFSFDGRVTVRVTKLQGDVDFCQVLPRSRQIAVRRSGRVVEFDLDRPGQVSVEFERGLKIAHPLFVFANPPEENVPKPGDPHVTYFGPGVHDIGEKFLIPDGQTVYLAGGAYVRGQFFSENTKNITIRGRGILSGEKFAVRTGHYMITMRNVEHAVVEGVTLIHPPTHNIRLNGRYHLVKNVKLFGWHFSTDGASTGADGMIEDSFMHVNDDSIMLYENNTSARRCVVWQMENGAPFQFGWGGDTDRSGFHAYDIDVIRMESEWDNENLAAFCAIHGGSGTKSNYLFENIRIDNADWRVFSIVTRPNRWGQWNPESGAIRGVVFRNIEYYGTPRIASLVMGHDEKHLVSDITFENVVIGGKKLTGPAPDVLAVDPETTRNVVFK